MRQCYTILSCAAATDTLTTVPTVMLRERGGGREGGRREGEGEEGGREGERERGREGERERERDGREGERRTRSLLSHHH